MHCEAANYLQKGFVAAKRDRIVLRGYTIFSSFVIINNMLEPKRRSRPLWFVSALFLFQRTVNNMELLAKYVIPLDCRAKKNSHRIAGSGPRCPMCGKFQKQFIRNGSTATDFAFRAAQYLSPRPVKPFSSQVHLIYRVYTATWHKKDDLNLYEALDDILVKEGVLADDNRKIIRSRDGSRVLYDKDNPRAEIYIYDYKEEDDLWLHKTVQKCLRWIASLVSTNPETGIPN